MNSRKHRQKNRLSPEEFIMMHVREIADKPFVRSVEDHFAGYFNELGIHICLEHEVTEAEFVDLRNNLLDYLTRSFESQQLCFTWQVGFWRGEAQVGLLFPGDDLIQIVPVIGFARF